MGIKMASIITKIGPCMCAFRFIQCLCAIRVFDKGTVPARRAVCLLAVNRRLASYPRCFYSLGVMVVA